MASGAHSSTWKGGIIFTKQGYVEIKRQTHPNAKKSGYVPVHRLVMSDHLGRPLAHNEVVHHLNGDRADNSLENLVLMTRSDHHSHHHKGVSKPNSRYPRLTSEQVKELWRTKRIHQRIKAKFCTRCDSPFVSRNHKVQKYCSMHCYNIDRATSRMCTWCAQSYHGRAKQFCSKICANRFHAKTRKLSNVK